MAITKYEHPNVSSVLVESDVTVPQVAPYTNLFCPIISEKGPDRKLEYVTSPEDFIFKFGEPNFGKYGQANYNAYNALKAGAGAYVLRTTPEYLDVNGDPVEGSAKYANLVIGVGFKKTSGNFPLANYNLKPIVKSNTTAYNLSVLENSLAKVDVDGYTEYKFLAIHPKGRGESYNNLGITLTPIRGRYSDTYPWYIYSLTVYRNLDGIVSKLENFIVSLDPNAKSVVGNSYFICDILDRYSKYLVAIFDENVWNLIETDIGISASKLNIVNAFPFKNDYSLGNTYGKKVTKRMMTADITTINDKFTTLANHNLENGDIISFVSKKDVTGVILNTNYYVKNKTLKTFEISSTLGGLTVTVGGDGEATFLAKGLDQVVYNRIILDADASTNTFIKTNHGFVDNDRIIFNTKIGVDGINIDELYYVIKIDDDSFKVTKFSETTPTPVNILTDGTVTYNTTNLTYLTITDLPEVDMGFIDGSNRIPYLKNGHDGIYTNTGLVDGNVKTSNLHKTGTFVSMMLKAFGGVYDVRITQPNETEIDLVLDADYGLLVKQKIIDFVQQYRKDCFAILDLNTNNTQADYLDIRLNQLTSMNDNDELEEIMVDTRFVALISGDRYVEDSFTKKNIQVTLTYYLAYIIPNNDKLYGIGKNFVGVNRSVITDYIDSKGSYFPTDPEKEELYNNQINYLTKTYRELYFDSQETTVTKKSAMGEISKARAYLRIERLAKTVCNRTQWEYATEEVYKNLESSIASTLESFVKDGTCEYIRPRVWADDYAKANKLVYVNVELRFTDIIERVEISFNVAR